MRLHELHAAVGHFPLALLPASLGFDLAGRGSGSEPLLKAGRTLAPWSAAGALVSAGAGLVARAGVKAEGEPHPLLITHKN